MNTKRILFWSGFVVILGLIVWGLILAGNKKPAPAQAGTPAPITNEDRVRGPENAPVTLIEYSDFQCPACASYFPLVEQFMAEASSTVRFVYRHFPLPQHFNAGLTARSAEAAGEQNKFWDMYRLLFENQTVWAELPDIKAREIIYGYASSLSLDMDKFKTDMDSEKIKNKVKKDLEEGRTIGVNSTPTFFLNGEKIILPASYDAFKSAIIDASTKNTRRI